MAAGTLVSPERSGEARGFNRRKAPRLSVFGRVFYTSPSRRAGAAYVMAASSPSEESHDSAARPNESAGASPHAACDVRSSGALDAELGPGPAPPAEAAANTAKLVLLVGAGAVVNPLNATMIAGAYKEIAAGFDATLSEASWLVTLYLGCTAALQPVAGALGDRLGRRAVFLAGIGAFTLASALATFAWSLPALVACRCAQAISSAMVIPNGLAIIQAHVPEAKRARAAGGFGAIMGLGAALGAVLGGVLVARGGWQSLFWFNVPLGALALACAAWGLPNTPTGRAELSPVALLGASLLPLAVGLELLHRDGSAAAGIAACAVAGATLALGAFAIRRSTLGRADAKLLTSKEMVSAFALIAMSQLLFFGTVFVLPAWIASALEASSRQAGLYVGLMTLVMVLVTPSAGRLADTRGVRVAAFGGALLVTAGLGLLALTERGIGAPRILCGLLLIGVGFGGAGPSLQRAALDLAPKSIGGLTLGLFQSARYLGSIAGAALLSASFAERATSVDVAAGVGILRKLIVCAALPSIAAALLLPAKGPRGDAVS